MPGRHRTVIQKRLNPQALTAIIAPQVVQNPVHGLTYPQFRTPIWPS
jgi:hypothetical protein